MSEHTGQFIEINGERREIRIPRMDPAISEIYARWTPAQRMRAGEYLTRCVRRDLMNEVASNHPDWSPDEVRREFARRWLAEEDIPGHPRYLTLAEAMEIDAHFRREDRGETPTLPLELPKQNMDDAPSEYTIRPLPPSAWGDVERLVEASVEEGFRFLIRLREEHASGANRFDGEGEVLLGVWRGGELVAVGGLNRDPYGGGPRAGRVRHVYVLPSARRAGVGRALVRELIDRAKISFDELVLRTDTAEAARFYEAIGFRAESEVEGATHRLSLADASARVSG
jgi:ribosomal protein S18 acetylase RimI-like enzyme